MSTQTDRPASLAEAPCSALSPTIREVINDIYTQGCRENRTSVQMMEELARWITNAEAGWANLKTLLQRTPRGITPDAWKAEALHRFNLSHRDVPAVEIVRFDGCRWFARYGDGKERPDYFFDEMTNLAVNDALSGPNDYAADVEARRARKPNTPVSEPGRRATE